MSLSVRFIRSFITEYTSYIINECCAVLMMYIVEEERRPALYRDLMSTSRIASLENYLFRLGCRSSDNKIKKGLEKIACIHRSLKQVDVMRLEQDAAEVLVMKAVMSVSDTIQVISYRMEEYRTMYSF